MKSFSKYKINILKDYIGKGKVLCGLSGGVDSSVTAALLDVAIGNQLICVFVDHGLLRYKESKEISKFSLKKLGNRFIKINASDIFLEALKGIKDPEEKRKIIGNKFVEVFEKEAEKIGQVEFLAQGTFILMLLSLYLFPEDHRLLLSLIIM